MSSLLMNRAGAGNFEECMSILNPILTLAWLTTLHRPTIRARSWLMVPFYIGGLCEIAGYAGRAISSAEDPGAYTLGPYILQSVTILVAPALFAASIYMALGRIVLLLDADSKLSIRRTWVTKIFVLGDVISFMMQSGGAGVLSSAKGDAKKSKTGQNIIVAGLIVQLICFGIFVTLARVCHRRIVNEPTKRSIEKPWSKHMYALYVVSFLIFVRSIVRVVEFIQGFEGEIISHEWFLYVFDATPMFLVMILLNWINPTEVVRMIRQEARQETRQEGLRMEQAGV